MRNSGRGSLFVGAPITDPSQARQIADDHPLLAGQLPRGKPPSLDDILDTDGLVVDRRDDQAADVPNAADFLGTQRGGRGVRALHPQHLVHRVDAAAKQADAPDRHSHRTLAEVVAPHRGVGVRQRRLNLAQRDAVAAQAVGVGLHLVAPHRAAEAGDVHDARHRAKLRLQQPVLHRLDIVQRVDLVAGWVLGDFHDIAVDFACGGLWRNRRGHVGRQRLADRGQAVDHFLSRRLIGVLAAVVPRHLEIAQAEQRLAVDFFEAGHSSKGDFQGDRDLPLDLQGRRAGEQRNHLDDGRRRVGVGFNVHVQERSGPEHREEHREQDDHQRIIQRPGNELSNHVITSGGG